MKVWPSLKKTLIMAGIVFLFSAIVVFTSLIQLFLTPPWDYRQWLIIGVFLVSSIVILILTLTTYFYVIEQNQLVVVKFRKALFYPYSDVIYIDQNPKKKTSTITILMKSGHSVYLVPDKNNKIYEALEKNCNHLLSQQEVMSKFPRIKL